MTRHPFEYAVLRAVPRIERGECVNVGVLLYCQERDFLGARTHVDADRLRALHPDVDVDALRRAVAVVEAACAGDPVAGPVAEAAPGARFRWLASPRSTVLQVGPVHAGVTADPEAELDHLFRRLVL